MDWMQEKNKKTILNIIILMAISFAFISLFAPINCIDYSDVLEQNGYENPDLYWKKETSFLLNHLSEYDYRNSENHQEFHRYSLFHLLNFETGEPTGEFSTVNDYDILSENNKNPPISYTLYNMLELIISFLLFVIFIFFSVKIINKKSNKKDKYILYNSITILIIFILSIASAFYLNYFKDHNNLGYMDAWTFGYGFYLMIVSITLFFIAYFMKRYFFEFKRKTQNL